jgi:hypothetical protein
MFEYKYVKIEMKSKLFSYGPRQDYREIVEQHAKEGWRFVQIFAPGTRGYGIASYFEIIFEKQVD